MDKVDFATIAREAKELIRDPEAAGGQPGYAEGVRDLAAVLMFPDIPEAIAIELADTAIKSEHW